MLFKQTKPTPATLEEPKEESFADLLFKVGTALGNPRSLTLDEESRKKIFQAMASIDGIDELLRDIMVLDMQRHFVAQSDHDRNVINGGFARTAYLQSEVLKARE